MTHEPGQDRKRGAPVAALVVAVVVPALALVVILGLLAAFFHFMGTNVPAPPPEPPATTRTK